MTTTRSRAADAYAALCLTWGSTYLAIWVGVGAAGFAGTVMLAGGDLGGVGHSDWRGPAALSVAGASWAFGSVYLQRRLTQSGPYANAAIQMLVGGRVRVAAGTVGGEWGAWTLPWEGLAALAYLTVAGSLVGFSSYLYVLRSMPATVAGTYAYVNTVIAVLLGWLVLGESLSGRTASAMGVVIGAVIWVRVADDRPRPSSVPSRPQVRRPSRPSLPVPAAAGIGDG